MIALSPTQFIFQAALKSGKLLDEVKLNLHEVPDRACWLCGGLTEGEGVSAAKVIRPTFTDASFARCLSSHSLCAGCVFCLSSRILRNHSILATKETLFFPRRDNLKQVLLNPPTPPFLLCIAVSGHKHLHFKARVSYSTDNYPVLMEESLIYVQREILEEHLKKVEALLQCFPKQEILTGRYSLGRISKFGRKKFEEIEEELVLIRRSRLFKLAVLIAGNTEGGPHEKTAPFGLP